MTDYSIETVLDCGQLPTLPTVAVELLEVTRSDDCTFKAIEEVVQHDPALTSKILKTVNSSYYGLAQPCPTIGRALTYLGLNTVKSLVLGFSIVETTGDDAHAFDLLEYWERCLCSAAAARRIASQAGGCDPDEPFIAALMQDIGMLAMEQALGQDYAEVVASAGFHHEALPAAERERFGFDHAEVGAAMGERWRLPDLFLDPIRCHHGEDLAALPDDAITRIVFLSHQVARVVKAGPEVHAACPYLAETAERLLGFSAPETEVLVHTTANDARELGRLFKIRENMGAQSGELMAQAQEVLFEHQLQVQREADALEEQNRELSEQAYTDALTGAANRARFDETIETEVDQARIVGGCLGLIMGDADRFKKFNDTYGHLAGDAVLIELVRRMTEVVGDRGLVCRYGGEEFAVILPNATRADTAQVAEQIRITIASRPFDLSAVEAPADTVEVTSSFGAAAIEPASRDVFTSPQVLLQAADKALYVAKEAGRNCVRVFKPKVPAAA